MIKYSLLIGTGGFIGSVARYYLSRAVQQTLLSSFPFGTFVVNVAGCLLIGFMFGIAEKSAWFTPEWRLFLTVGLCGGFTTFSTFASESYNLLRDGQFTHFFLYPALSVTAGLIAVYFGHLLAKTI